MLPGAIARVLTRRPDEFLMAVGVDSEFCGLGKPVRFSTGPIGIIATRPGNPPALTANDEEQRQ